MAIRQKRDKGVKVLMTESMHAKLYALGERLGQPPGTLASMAVSEFVNRYESQLVGQEKAIQAMVDLVGPALAQQMELTGGSS